MTRVLVTGAAGFIGSHLCEALAGAGHDVVGVDNFDPFYAKDIKERNLGTLHGLSRFQFFDADVGKDELPLGGVDAIVHLAGRPGVRPSLEDPIGYIEANVTATTRLLDLARQAKIPRLVFGSSSSVYGQSTPAPFSEEAVADAPISPYAATKRAGELICRAFNHLYGTRIACLRFFTVYGPRQRPDLAIHRFTARISAGLPIAMHGDGSSERDYTYISDCIDGIVSALAWTEQPRPEAPDGFRVFNIGGGSRVRLDRLIGLIGAGLGREPMVEHRPDQPGDVPLTAADLRRSGRELSYRPRVPIEEGIRHFIRWYEGVHGPKP